MDRFDVCEGFWVFALDWHGGSGFDHEGRPCGIDTNHRRNRPHHHLDIEAQLLQTGFRPRLSLRFETLTEEGRAVYDGLVSRFGYERFSDGNDAAPLLFA